MIKRYEIEFDLIFEKSLWNIIQSISALIISVSAAHGALFSKIMSDAHRSAHFLKCERRSRLRSQKLVALFCAHGNVLRSFCAHKKNAKVVFIFVVLHNSSNLKLCNENSDKKTLICSQSVSDFCKNK